MIKFFRHIRKSLIEQNKMGKYFKYAIGEIILVVIGILIALQINNWNNYNNERKKEKSILKELQKEFLGNKAQFDSVKKVHYRSMKSLNTIIDSLPLSEKQIYSLIGDFGFATNTFTFNPSNGVVNSLINSGNYELIQNDTLRNYLVTWQDVYQDFLEEELNHQKYRYEVFDPRVADKSDFALFQKGDKKAIEKSIAYIMSSEFRNHLFMLRGRLTNVISDLDKGTLENHLNVIIRLSKTND